VTLLGTIRVSRPYYHCRPCRAGHSPRDADLGLGPDRLTRGAAVLAGLRVRDVGRRPAAKEAHRRDDPAYRKKGWMTGSGPVEAACKPVVNQRLKVTGARWSEEGADAVCHLRALFRSELGQWDAYWATTAA